MVAPKSEDGTWHLDKRIPLSLMFAILIQTTGAFWWASKVDTLQAQNVTLIAENRRDIRQLKDSNGDFRVKLAEVQRDVKYTNQLIGILLRSSGQKVPIKPLN